MTATDDSRGNDAAAVEDVAAMGAVLKSIREDELKLTLRALKAAMAERGVSVALGSISMYERGLNDPPVEYLTALADLAGRSIEYPGFTITPAGTAEKSRGVGFRDIPVSELIAWPGLNPRSQFDEDGIDELAASLKESGVLLPLSVHRPPGDEWSTGWVVAGERRLRAAVRAGLSTVPCLVREYTLQEALDVAIVENLQRENISELDEARGFQRWLDIDPSRTQRQLAERLGKKKSQPVIANRIRLLSLPAGILELLDQKALSMKAARDCLLPFIRIPEAPRAKLFREVEKAIRKRFESEGSEGLEADDVYKLTAPIAAKVSKPITDRIYSVDPEAPLFGRAAHGACSCKGPIYPYDGAYRKAARCFDAAWWTAAQEAARAASQAQQEARGKNAANALDDLDRNQVITREALGRLGINDWEVKVHTPGDVGGRGTPLLDPAELPVDRCFLAEGWRPDDPYALICLDEAAFARARKSAAAEVKRRLAERRRSRLEADLVAYTELSMAQVLSALLAHDGMPSWNRGNVIHWIADDLGLKVGPAATLGSVDQLGEFHVEKLARVLALRIRRGDLRDGRDALEEEVRRELAAEYLPAIEALRPAVPEASANAGGRLPFEEPLEQADCLVCGGEVDAVELDEQARCIDCSMDAFVPEEPETDAPELPTIVFDSAEIELPREAAVGAEPEEDAATAQAGAAAARLGFIGDDADRFTALVALPSNHIHFNSHRRLASARVLRAAWHAIDAAGPGEQQGSKLKGINQELKKRGLRLLEPAVAHA